MDLQQVRTLVQDYAFQRGFNRQLEVIPKSKVSLSIKIYKICFSTISRMALTGSRSCFILSRYLIVTVWSSLV